MSAEDPAGNSPRYERGVTHKPPNTKSSSSPPPVAMLQHLCLERGRRDTTVGSIFVHVREFELGDGRLIHTSLT